MTLARQNFRAHLRIPEDEPDMTKALESAREIVDSAGIYGSTDPSALKHAAFERLTRALNDHGVAIARALLERDAPSDIPCGEPTDKDRQWVRDEAMRAERDATMREALDAMWESLVDDNDVLSAVLILKNIRDALSRERKP